jgi:hypothetical protein
MTRFTATISIRSIENGVICTVNRGMAYGKQEISGEFYYPDIGEALDRAKDLAKDAPEVAERFAAEAKKKGNAK